MRSKSILVIVLLLAAPAVVVAQSSGPIIGAWSPSLPPLSPVASYSMDDIPPTAVKVVMAANTLVNARANFMLSYMDVSDLEQKVWFTLSAHNVPGAVYYNRRTRASILAGWTWDYAQSPKVLDVVENHYPPGQESQRPPSFAMGQVIFDPVPRFRNPANNQYYNYIMYNIYQPTSCDGTVLGFLVISYSTNGTTWVGPWQVVRDGGPVKKCWPGRTLTVPVEAAGAVYDGSSTLYLMGLEGDVCDIAGDGAPEDDPELEEPPNCTFFVNPQNFDRTFASVSDRRRYSLLAS